MLIATNPAQVLAALPLSARFIAVDGMFGAGKSELASCLHERMPAWKYVDADTYLTGRQGEFISALNVPALAAALCGSHTLFSGACMLRVLEVVGIVPDVLVYVKRMAAWGWADVDYAYGEPEDWWCAADVEVRDYHRCYEPDLKASIIFERYD
jgi:hypothetical protein